METHHLDQAPSAGHVIRRCEVCGIPYWAEQSQRQEICPPCEKSKLAKADTTALLIRTLNLLNVEMDRVLAERNDLLIACEAVFNHCPCDPDINPQWHAAWNQMVAAIKKAAL
jgi:hypothetical protein